MGGNRHHNIAHDVDCSDHVTHHTTGEGRIILDE